MTSYDEQYREENLFGEPYLEFVSFMAAWNPKGRVLDVGCGQGRDSLFLAEQGYSVTGIDASQVGIAQMLELASAQNLDIQGIVADLFTYDFTDDYDVIVLDSILHFGKEGIEGELRLLENLCRILKDKGIICLFVHKSKAKEKHLKSFFQKNFPSWQVLKDTYIDYTYFEKASGFKSAFQYHMYIVQKAEA